MDFCRSYTDCFDVARRNVGVQARRYLNGLLVKAPRKNLERMEEYVEGFDYQSQQQFLSDSPWSHREVVDRAARDVSAVMGGPDCGLIIDESAFAKKGDKSAGVARQWNGRLGKVDNCQVGVFASLCDGASGSLVDARLYLPEAWTSDPGRCARAKIPEADRTFRTKPEIALEMVEHASELGLEFGWTGFDAVYGASDKLLLGIHRMGREFVGDARSSRTVRRRGRAGRPVRMASLFARLRKWREVDVRMGEKGMLRVRARAVRAWIGGADGFMGWAVCVRDEAEGRTCYFLSNAPADTPLEALVRRHAVRSWIERNFQDGKTSLGMADYQVRGWRGWHHHMAMVALAMLFLLRERRVHMVDMDLLSCTDVVELLDVFLPRRDATVEDVLRNIERRHQRRRAARDRAQAKQSPDQVILTE